MKLNDDEFVEWWEQHREAERKWVRQLSVGLPVGLVFGFPILLSLVFRGWYKRMPYVSGAQFTLILMASLGIAVFISVFRMHFRWEQHEQRYLEIKSKRQSS